MIKDAQRASEVIQRVRALSKKTEPQKAALDINDVISEVVRLVQREVFGHAVSLRLELAPDAARQCSAIGSSCSR